MEYYAYTLYDEVQDFFNASKLIIVAWASKSSRTGKWNTNRNKTPATSYFNRVSVSPINETMFHLTHKRFDRTLRKVVNKPFALMEKTDQGGEWRYYNKPTIEESTQRLLMVEGDPNVDLYHANPAVRVTDQGNGISLIENISIINESPWEEAKRNVDIDYIGCMWYMRQIEGGDYVQGGYIANGNFIDLNRGSGRVSFCKLTERTDVEICQDVKGDTDKFTETADYVYTEEDRLDPEKEYLTLTIYYGVKQAVSPLVLPVETVLPNPFKTEK